MTTHKAQIMATNNLSLLSSLVVVSSFVVVLAVGVGE